MISEALTLALSLIPRCACGAFATWSNPDTPDMESGRREAPTLTCDEHRQEGCGRPHCCDPDELERAADIRRLAALLAPRGPEGG